MTVKLRVLHGTLRRQHGGSAGADVKVRGEKFVIGSGMDCQMRCPSSTVSPHHCEIVTEFNQVVVRDLGSETGTFVNNERLEEARVLQQGDHLRIGRLEFEVIFEVPPPPAQRPADSVGDRISDMLTEADQEDRAQRYEDPAKRKFAVNVPDPAPQPAEPPGKKKPVLPPKKSPPQKLPARPPVVADSTVEAAEEVLKKFFDKPKK